MKKIISIYGWVGVLIIILAYVLVSFNILKPTNIVYQAMNCIGALGMIIESYDKKDYQSTVLNIVWASIALIAILKLFI